MGYRSDVAVHLRADDYCKLMEEYDNNDKMLSFMDEFESKKFDDNTLTLYVEDIKWYDGVDAEVTRFMEDVRKIPSIVVIIGEDMDDIQYADYNISPASEDDSLDYMYDNAPRVQRKLDIG